MSISDTLIVFWKGMTRRIGVKLTDKLLIGNIDTEKSQYIDVQDLPFINRDALQAEAAARATADDSLQQNIDSEAAARSTADSNLQQAINAEASARSTADSNHSNNISVLQKTSFRHLASDTDLDTVLTPGAYYIGSEELPDSSMIQPLGESKDLLFVVGTKDMIVSSKQANDITQYLVRIGGISVRKHYSEKRTISIINGEVTVVPAYWDEWTLIDPAVLVTAAYLSENVKRTESNGGISYLGKNNEVILTDNGSTVGISGGRKFLVPTVPLSGNVSRYYARDANGYMVGMTAAQMKSSLSVMEDAPENGKFYARRNGLWVEVKEDSIKLRITVTLYGSDGVTVVGAGTYAVGAQVTVVAQVQSGYAFLGWYEDSAQVSSSENYAFIAQYDRTLYTMSEGATTAGPEEELPTAGLEEELPTLPATPDDGTSKLLI